MLKANWIKVKENLGDVCPIFERKFTLRGKVKSATLRVTARGVYMAEINGKRVGDFILAPGWTVYEKRIQVQTYDVTHLLQNENNLHIHTAKGWYLGRICGAGNWNRNSLAENRECAVIAELNINYTDGTSELIGTDSDWSVAESKLRFCDLYDGEIYDASFTPEFKYHTVVADNNDFSVLVPQQGEKVIEQERIKPVALIHTPKGETVIDFGQNLTGYLEISLNAHKGEAVEFSFAEILDKDGNFYNGNYRSAKALYSYTCKEGEQTHKPTLTFYGFRYVRIDKFPQRDFALEQFTAIVLHSEMKRTGKIETSDPMLNQLFSNIIWGQKGNFLDVPTDCPQRDERLGWTGDAQVFVKTASYNFDVQRFFTKWLTDMSLSQGEDGRVPAVIPNVLSENDAGGAAWSDAVTICPWQMYLTYGDTDILKQMFPAMKKYVDYITSVTTTPYLWTGNWQYSDWLELDNNAKPGEVITKGNTSEELLATAFYAYSALLVCKAGAVLGEDVEEYKALYQNIVSAFKNTFKDDFKTQTEHVLALHFGLTDHPKEVTKSLVEKIHSDGDMLKTGFVGTPYLLHALSENGESELAYKILLRKDYPSWLYPITKGATTMWEHWDGFKPNGEIWSDAMNSYNHYAYGAVADWMYGVAAGINTVESAPGFEEILFKPTPTDEIDSFCAEIESKYGKISSRWWHEDGIVKYEITTPSPAKAIINGKKYNLIAGVYRF
ncbi:MAG: family 78 glycoside hydrolase catalytic domain [Clostridia bacterium]|nr:family 78 glycoside hydrolase catalytic domain [Clostridia bacterium]